MSGLQECKGNGLLEVGRDKQKFSVGSTKSQFLYGGLPLPTSTSLKKLVGGGSTSTFWEHHTPSYSYRESTLYNVDGSKMIIFSD